jgi:uncharacterized protein
MRDLMQSYKFQWDELKHQINLKKYGIAFEDAAAVFSDPYHLTALQSFDDFEERWKTYGIVDGYALIVVAHTYRQHDGGEVIRIISARRATKHERLYYERKNY